MVWREPAEVRIEEEEDDHADGHEIHVDEEDHACVVEAPAALEAAGGVGGAEDGEDDGEEEQGSGAVVGEVGEPDGGGEGRQDEQASADEGVTAEVEEVSAEKVVVWLVKRRSRGSGGVPHTSSIGARAAPALFWGRGGSSDGSGGGRSRHGKRRQIAEVGDGHFDGAETVTGEVVDADAQEVIAFDGDADLLVNGKAGGEYDLHGVGCDVGAGGCEGVYDERPILIVDVDAKLNLVVIMAVAGFGEEHGSGIGGDVDEVAAIGSVR